MINIAFCFDKNVIDYIKVSILSLLSNKNKDTHYNIIGICSSDAYGYVNELRRLVCARDAYSCIDIKETSEVVKDAYEIRNITSATYYRFDLAEFFPDVDKVIYLDADTFINGDLSELWNRDIGENYVCGVRADVNLYNSWENKLANYEYWKELEDWRGNYINAGVMIMNLQLIRKNQLAKLWKSKVSYPYFYQDQDIINITCKPSIGILPMKYNSMTFYTEDDYSNLVYQNVYNKKEVEVARNTPVIVHYAGKKPWSDLDTKCGYFWWNFVMGDLYLKEIFQEKYYALSNVDLSIIIPVYNSSKYLRPCLDSIVSQDSETYEIICMYRKLEKDYPESYFQENAMVCSNIANILQKYSIEASREIDAYYQEAITILEEKYRNSPKLKGDKNLALMIADINYNYWVYMLRDDKYSDKRRKCRRVAISFWKKDESFQDMNVESFAAKSETDELYGNTKEFYPLVYYIQGGARKRRIWSNDF